MEAVMKIKEEKHFQDINGLIIHKEDTVWFDPYSITDEDPIYKEPFMVIGLSKTNDDILLMPVDKVESKEYNHMYRTSMKTVTHKNPYHD